MTIFQLYRNIQSLDIQLMLESAVEINTDVIIDLQNQQLDESKTSKGSSILPKYSEEYAKRKGFSSPDLKLSGDWRSEITVIIDGQDYYIISYDEKSAFLLPKYENLLGLNSDSKDVIRPIVTNSFAQMYKHAINL